MTTGLASGPGPFRRWLFAAATIALSLLVAALLIEVVIRVLGLGTALVYVPNPLYGWSHRPSNTFVWVTEGRREQISINSLRLRDREFSYQRQEGRARLLVLGDSFVEALQVPLQASYTKQLEAMLNGTSGATEVINGGVSGYGTDNELLYWREQGHRFSPDVLLLCLYVGNDVRNNFNPLELVDAGTLRKPHFSLQGNELVLHDFPFPLDQSFGTRLKLALNLHWRSYAFLREMKDRLRHSQQQTDQSAPLDFGVFARDPDAQWQQAWMVTVALLSEFERSAAKLGTRLVVVIVPSHFQVYEERWQAFLTQHQLDGAQWDLDAPNRRLGEFLQVSGIDFIDLLPGLRAQAKISAVPLYFTIDEHWTEAGHQAAAALTAAALRVPESP